MENNIPVIAIYQNGVVEPRPGATVGELLRALDLAREALLNIVVRAPAPPVADQQVTDQSHFG